MEDANAISSKQYWHSVWSAAPKHRLPSSLNVGVRDLKALLSRYMGAGADVLELGCAPGKMLAWISCRLGSRISGIDYSERGVDQAHALFRALEVPCDLRCEDVFSTTFVPGTFDCVYSVGLIEHFKDPSELVRKHVELLKPGGAAVILIPDYRGLYGKLQRHFDPDNLTIHNLDIMSKQGLVALVPSDLAGDTRVFRWGKLNPWLVNWNAKWPKLACLVWCLTLNVIGLIQPVRVDRLSPWIVLEIRRAKAGLAEDRSAADRSLAIR
jgi:SAM-dependent methyltransferase